MSKEFMKRAIELSITSVGNGTGPFGAVLVKDNQIISEGFNTVTMNNDPTSHAEIVAVRIACKKLSNFSLEGCDLYTTCEPCPMCYGAIHWAKLPKCVFACSADDAAKHGFDDRFIYDAIRKETDEVHCEFIHTPCEDAVKVFELDYGKY